MANDDLKALVRMIPDFPRPGIQFRDVTTLLLDGAGFSTAIERLAARIAETPDLIAGIEARGFVVAAALAQQPAAEPNLEKRHQMGIVVLIFLIFATVLAYLAYQNIWHAKKHEGE